MSDSLRPAHRTVASSCVLRPGAPGVERLEPRTLLTTAIDIAPRANYSAVSMNGAGDFVAAWTDPQTDTLYARRFDSGGAPRTDALVVGSGLSGNVSQPAIDVALNDAGGFVVAWTDAHRDVRAREFDASDAPRGDAVVVNPVPTGQYPTASVGIDADGDFVVAWMADEAQRSPPSASYVRVFDAAGNPRSDAQRANPPATGGAHPDVAVEPDGDFVVA